MRRKHVRRTVQADPDSAAPGSPSGAAADNDVDPGRLIGDVAGFESANGVPHDVLAVGVVGLGVMLVHGIASAVRWVLGARRLS